ncbi:putative cysteine dioxygenase [metagenome]|uniref:Putative cysteine dioxygenase n=1 Tax=metagenome TaxID=256318 RepID=A0A2P2BZD5_9ZZZZ
MTLTTTPLWEVLQQHSRDRSLTRLLDPAHPERQWRRLEVRPELRDILELWLISWPAGAGTGWHDHGAASGAFTVLQGALTEYAWNGAGHSRILLPAGARRDFVSQHIHDVVNEGWETAVSLHAYRPRLQAMTKYELVRGHLEVSGVERAGGEW